MIGLLRNIFYSTIESAVIFLVVYAVAGVCLIVTGSPPLLNIFVLISATAFALIAASSFRREASSKWNKYELTAPVRRNDIVKSRYISHLAWLLIGAAIAAVFVGLTLWAHGNRFFFNEIRDPLSLFCASIGTSLFMGAFFYPAIYFWGADKNEIVIIMSLLGSAGLTAGTLWLINAAHGFTPVSDAEFYVSVSLYMATAIAFFLLSYFLSVCIYRRKEY